MPEIPYKKNTINALLIMIFSTVSLCCTSPKKFVSKPKNIYKSKHLLVKQLSENTFQHISYLQTNDFGNVPCNGLVVKSNHEAIIFDTPTNDISAAALIKWIQETLQCKIIAIVPTHFHDDCLGGLKTFHEQNIPSYANLKTVELAKENDYVVPKNSFKDSLLLKVGKETIRIKFLGEGHTKDNVVGYFPSENVLFGGCLIKELNASKGYLGDANIEEWSATVQKVKNEFPNVKIVVPGHGTSGSIQLLDYTINLFKDK